MTNGPAGAGVELLRGVPLFERLDEDQLVWLAGRAEPLTISSGQVLVAEGDPADAMFVVVDGMLEATKVEGGRAVRLGVYGPGEPLGELGLLARRNRSATVQALQDSTLLRIDDAAFSELLDLPSVARRILDTVLARLESQEARLRQHAKMAALGTLAAGLLHDLNNPAAAIRASVRRLDEVLHDWRALGVELARAGPEVTGAVEALLHEAGEAPAAGSLERSDREEELLDWLEARGVADAWKLAPMLADLGLSSAGLDELAGPLDSEQRDLAVRWMSLDGEVARILSDTGRAADHVAEVTRRSKRYSRVDEAPVGEVDVNDGIETALTLVRSKIGGVLVRREFGDDLPAIEGYPADLNEVWLNLLDNALDAMDGDGELTLRTAATPEGGVVVEVTDDGPGIPGDLQERVFEPFFTTKPPGAGTGLGLAQVYRIVVTEHGGEVDAESRPGRTCFRVTLPPRLSEGPAERGRQADLAGSDV